MGRDDRRFLILEASDEYKEDKRYFAALDKQMHREGGLQALLYDLQHEDLTDFDVRTKPHSSHGFDIKIRSAEPIVRWWHEKLHIGIMKANFSELGTESDWCQTPHKNYLYQEFLTYCDTHNHRTMGNPAFGKQLHKMLPGCIIGETRPTTSGRPRCYTFPPLPECREAFQRYMIEGPYIWE